MFLLNEATDVRERLGELGRFLEYWFGPRSPGFGEPVERLEGRSLPFPLAWFYTFAGRWPPGVPGYTLEDFFYTGAAHHHLFLLDMIAVRPDGRLEFYSEYQGDWSGLTLPEGEDPPVWIEGRWIDGDREVSGEKRVSASLSRFLVTHCLLAMVYEDDNSPSPVILGRTAPNGRRLIEWFRASHDEARPLWDSSDCDLPHCNGTFFLLDGGILVYRLGDDHDFRAIHPEGIRRLEAVWGRHRRPYR